jgi:gliding motility-associated-like protein
VNFTDLSTNSPNLWLWSFPGGTPSTSNSQNPTNICYSATGNYTVTLIAVNSDGSDTLTQVGYITVGGSSAVTITGTTLINSCEEAILYANPSDGSYVWGPATNLSCGSCSAATVTPSVTTDYYVTYTNPGGCTASDTVTVSVQEIFTYYMPTGFSPNGDGINDILHVQGRGIDYINLKIFDRIGEKVFETTDPETGWDGKVLGLRMNDNTFVYTLEVTFCNGETVKEHGSLMLAR